ncbi:MAG: hypothetical protein NC489_40325 [Ruminococcus flavefaciens]|nr:hypothetical protein [Ruminococcus flavefaciens]
MIKKIVNLLPSETLKNYVFLHNFKFTEKDLLKFIDEYSPYLDVKLSLFKSAAELFCDKQTKLQAEKLIAFQKNALEIFKTCAEDEVYETDIKCSPYDSGETYITKTYEGALELIKKYLKYYGDIAKEDENSYYTIVKKSASVPKKPSDFSYKKNIIGDRAECVLGKGLRVKRVDNYKSGYEYGLCRGKDCDDCRHVCVKMHCPAYPPFLEKYSLVAYKPPFPPCFMDRRLRQGDLDIRYGVFLYDMNEVDNDSYVLDLTDNPYIKDRTADKKEADGYYHVYDAHCHPDLAEIFVPDKCDVPGEIYGDYLYTVDVLKKLEEE